MVYTPTQAPVTEMGQMRLPACDLAEETLLLKPAMVWPWSWTQGQASQKLSRSRPFFHPRVILVLQLFQLEIIVSWWLGVPPFMYPVILQPQHLSENPLNLISSILHPGSPLGIYPDQSAIAVGGRARTVSLVSFLFYWLVLKSSLYFCRCVSILWIANHLLEPTTAFCLSPLLAYHWCNGWFNIPPLWCLNPLLRSGLPSGRTSQTLMTGLILEKLIRLGERLRRPISWTRASIYRLSTSKERPEKE